MGKDGAVFLAGWYQDSTASPLLAWVAKYDERGTPLWSRTLGGVRSGGPRNANVGTGLALDLAGNVLFAGRFVGTASFDASAAVSFTAYGDSAAFVTRYSPDGTLRR